MQGLRIGVTGARKADQFVAALRQRGAEPVVGAMLSGDQPASDDEILADTKTVLAMEPQWVVASTGTGMRLWVEAADRGGLGEQLRDCLAGARCVARGAKAVGGLVGAGVSPVWTSPRETDADVAGWLEDHVLGDERVAVQLHGGRTHAYRHLSGLGVDLLTVMPYRSGPPDDVGPARWLIREVVDATLDVVTFTSPSAARNMFAIAQDMGDDVVVAMRRRLQGDVAVASIGPVTSDALEDLGAIVTITPRRYRTGDLLRSMESWASSRNDGWTPSPDLRLRRSELQAQVGDLYIELGPREFDVLATLARSAGTVFRPEELVAKAWGHEAPSDPALVRNQVARLRRKLVDTPVDIQTVRGVGYRLVTAT